VSAIADIVDSSTQLVSLAVPRRIYFRGIGVDFFYLLHRLGECGVFALRL
jgi:hypothetical protein